MKTHIQVNPNKLGGKPTVGASRFSIAQLIAELADGDRNLREICEDFQLNYIQAHEAVHQIAFMFDRKFTEGENEGISKVLQGLVRFCKG